MEQQRVLQCVATQFRAAEIKLRAPDFETVKAGLMGWIFENWWYFWWYGSAEPSPTRPDLYSESGADGRTRTGDALFTNQAAIEFSSIFWLSIYS